MVYEPPVVVEEARLALVTGVVDPSGPTGPAG